MRNLQHKYMDEFTQDHIRHRSGFEPRYYIALVIVYSAAYSVSKAWPK